MSASWGQQANRDIQDGPATERPRKASWETGGAVVLLLLLLVIFFWPAVFGCRVLLPTDLIFKLDPLWQPLAPEEYAHPTNQILSDQAYQFFPWRAFTVRSLAQGRLPLWNPYINCGQPFVGNAQSAVFNPFSLLGYILPLYTSYIATAVLRLFIAGVLTFLFAREIGLGSAGALLAMVAFTFSGPMIMWLAHPHSSVIVWLPAMLLTIERALTRKSAPYVIACGLTVGAQFLGGHPETSFHALLAWTAYALYRAVELQGWQPSRLLPQLLRIAAAVMIGVLLAAVQLLPFVEALRQSAILPARQAEAARQVSSLLSCLLLDWHEWPTVVTAILPWYFGTSLDDSYWFPYSNYIEGNAYVGVLPLALAAAAILHTVKRRSCLRRKPALFFALLAGVSLGIAIRLPLLNAANHLPLFNLAANGRMRMIYALAIATLAGLGLDEIRKERQEGYQRTILRILLALALASLVLIALAYAGFVVFEDEVIHSGRAFMESRWGTPYFSRPLEYYYALVEERYNKKLAQFLPSNVAMYLPVLIALLWLALCRCGQILRPGGKVWPYVALGLTILDLFLVNMSFHPTIAPEHVFPTPEAIQFLQQDPDIYRVSGTGAILNPNSNMLFDISDIRGYETVVPKRYADLIERAEGHFRFHFHSLFTQADAPLFDLLNVKYALTDQELDGKWKPVYGDAGSVRVYRNRDVLPRAFVVYRAEVVGSAAHSLERITDSGFDFRTRVLLEEMPTGWTEPAETPPSAVVRITGYEPNRVRMTVETTSDGLLVLTDTYTPGWKALLDGRTTPVYVADHAFRAVVVPAGAHQVEFLYDPLSFRIGAAVSLVIIVALALALLLSRVLRTEGTPQ